MSPVPRWHAAAREDGVSRIGQRRIRSSLPLFWVDPSLPIEQQKGPGLITNVWLAAGLCFWRLLFSGLNRVMIIGQENRPARGEPGVFLLYNHISAIDPFLVAATGMPLFSPIWWHAPAKEELFKIPLVRWILGTWGAFPVRRGRGDRSVMEKMVRLIQSSVIVLAPEGTRSMDGRLLRGRAGVGKILYDARPPKVIPVAIRGTDEILPKGSVLPAIGKKTWIRYGAPMDLSSYYEREDDTRTSQAIVDAVMAELARLLEDLDQQRRT